MPELLFLTHRIPYPPDKGDKIRSWNFLQHLVRHYDVHLGCLIDENRDWQFTDLLRGMCSECCFVELKPSMARRRSVRGLFDGRPLSLPYYYDAVLDRWVTGILSRPNLSHIFVYCSAMAQYIPLEFRRSARSVADLVDVDSEKWFDYARSTHLPMSRLWRREGRKLRTVEKEIARTFDATLVATVDERDLLQSLVPEVKGKISCVINGVDSEYFSPDRPYETPHEMHGTPLVFTGAMDYYPNIDAVSHFCRSILPQLRERISDLSLFVVGSNPKREIQSLAAAGAVVVTGRVPDVRPYIAHAKAVVAPMRIARGVQNKVLEGMAMAKPVIASPEAMVGINAEAGTEILVAEGPTAFVEAIQEALNGNTGALLGQNARKRVLKDYRWPSSLCSLETALNE